MKAFGTFTVKWTDQETEALVAVAAPEVLEHVRLGFEVQLTDPGSLIVCMHEVAEVIGRKLLAVGIDPAGKFHMVMGHSGRVVSWGTV